jgi:adenylate cyclase
MRLAGLSTWVIGLGLTLLVGVWHAADTPLGQSLRNAAHDTYLRLEPRRPDGSAPVHVIDIDEAALDLLGQWPWPRSDLAELTRRLYDLGALVVGFDVIFPELDRTSPSRNAAAPDGLDYDALFAAALSNGPSVLAVVGAPEGGAPVPKAGLAWTGPDPSGALIRFPGHVGNIPVLTAAASGLGSISLAPSGDGLVRRIPMVTVMGDRVLPSLSAEMLRVAQGAGGYVLRTAGAQGEMAAGSVRPVALRIGAVTVPLDGNGEMAVYFSAPQGGRVTSAADILRPGGPDPALADRIADRLVLIGSSAAGLYDIRSTPMMQAVPGVMIHAEALEQIVEGVFLVRPDWMTGLELTLVAATGLLLTWMLARDRPILGLVAMLAVVGGCLAGGFWAMQARGLIFDPAPATLAALAVFLPGAAAGVLQKERARRTIRARFAHFLPPDVLAQLVDDPSGTLTPQGAERRLTVMFVDMRQFSTVTEHMSPPEVVTLVNTYLAEITRTLLDHRATIDKFMGDAVMAFWNAPLDTPEHEALAVRAALALRGACDRVNARLAQHSTLPQIGLGVGVNTGPCSVGLMGSSDRLSYTCIGDTVNLAARLEGLTRSYGVLACFGGPSLAGLPAGLGAVELDVIAVKGRGQAEPVYAVLPDSSETIAFEAALRVARAAMLARDWDRAEAAFARLAALPVPEVACDVLAATFTDRIAQHRLIPPPPGWDGSTVARFK